MDPGTVPAVLRTADLCISHGKQLVEKIQTYRHADEEVQELGVCIVVHWLKMETQIDFLRGVWQSLDERLKRVQTITLRILELKLLKANHEMDFLFGDDIHNYPTQVVDKITLRPWNKVRYTILKKTFTTIIEDLDVWQQKFDPSWFLIMRVSGGTIDHQLGLEKNNKTNREFIDRARDLRDAIKGRPETGDSIFISFGSVSAQEGLAYTSAKVWHAEGDGVKVIIDTMILKPQANLPRTARDVRSLARILSVVDPTTFGLLKCRGVVRTTRDTLLPATGDQNLGKPRTEEVFQFIFSIPSMMHTPKSLRALLVAGDTNHPLNERFDLAKQLANSVMFIHTANFVHKNIRPETILVFNNNQQKSILGQPFLVGFEKFRVADGMTYLVGDSLFEHNLYRHPDRQGTKPEEEYVMQHDIYSLGVCLLEIGLWISFLQWPNGNTESKPIPIPDLELPDPLLTDKRKRAFAIKRALTEMATEKLPRNMGMKYTDIVMSCLTCLDADDVAGFADEDLNDEDGILVGVRYIENILLRIQDLSI
ncbi:hypothetical protein N431DRAFT_423682 [Stipitochalara longipes BDJ]|nr:hypothetical protein N431DRAFT_423682 [Stipitochalara longipes BDJ]